MLSPCLRSLRERGFFVGAAGNMAILARGARPAARGLRVFLRAAGESQKPSPVFFARLVDDVGRPAAEIAYVGDRVDNDVRRRCGPGMVAVHLRRGPWGHLQEPPHEAVRIRSLDELPEALP